MTLPGPHGCPCVHEDGYGHQTGRSFVRFTSCIDILEHMSVSKETLEGPQYATGNAPGVRLLSQIIAAQAPRGECCRAVMLDT
jgi:hypothetical protein